MKKNLLKGLKPLGGFLLTLGVMLSTNIFADELPRWDTTITQYNKSVVERFHPQFDFDGDGCYAATPFDRDRNLSQNPGLSATGTPGGACSDSNWVQFSNTLHRQLCKIQFTGSGQILRCAHFYELYFEKDQALGFSFLAGHRHDIETVIVWTGQTWDNGHYNEFATHVSTSAHGNYRHDLTIILFNNLATRWLCTIKMVLALTHFVMPAKPIKTVWNLEVTGVSFMRPTL